jgi:hypothetical protein
MTVRDQVTINDALEAFLVEQRGRLAAKTLRRYEDVVWLLRECLDRYGHSSLSADERRRWEKTFEGGEEDAFCRLFGSEKIPAHIDEFLDWFMVRKVMAGQDLLKASGDRSRASWCAGSQGTDTSTRTWPRMRLSVRGRLRVTCRWPIALQPCCTRWWTAP